MCVISTRSRRCFNFLVYATQVCSLNLSKQGSANFSRNRAIKSKKYIYQMTNAVSHAVIEKHQTKSQFEAAQD